MAEVPLIVAYVLSTAGWVNKGDQANVPSTRVKGDEKGHAVERRGLFFAEGAQKPQLWPQLSWAFKAQSTGL